MRKRIQEQRKDISDNETDNEFIAEGYSVGVIKHDGHRYEMDRKGTDTYEFLRAGARQTAIFAAEQFSLNFRETASDARLLNFSANVA